MAIRNRRGGGENLNIVKAARETAATTKKILTAKKAAQNGAGFVPSTSESPVVSNVLQVVDGITNDDDSVVGKSEPEEGYVIDKVRLSSKRRDRLDVAFERADAEVDADAAVLNQKDNGSLNEAVVEIGQDMVVIDEPKITPVSGLTTPLETTEPKVTTAPPTTQSSAVAEVEPGLIEKQLLVELKNKSNKINGYLKEILDKSKSLSPTEISSISTETDKETINKKIEKYKLIVNAIDIFLFNLSEYKEDLEKNKNTISSNNNFGSLTGSLKDFEGQVLLINVFKGTCNEIIEVLEERPLSKVVATSILAQPEATPEAVTETSAEGKSQEKAIEDLADNIEKRIQELSKRDNVDRRAIANYWARLKIAKDDDADKKEALDGLLEEINYELAQSDKEKKMEIVEKDGIEMHAYPHSLIEAALDTIAPINPEHEQLKNVLEKAREEYFYHYKNKLIEELDARKLGRLKLKLGIGAGFAEDAQLGSKNVGKDITLENLKQEYNKARIAFAKDLKGGGMGDNEIYKLIVLSEQEQLNNIRISIINSKKSNPDKAGFWTKTFEQWSSMKPAQKIAFSVLMVGGGAALGTIAAPIVAYMAGGSTAAFAAIGVSSADVASFIGLSAVTGLGKKLLAGTLAGGIFASVLNPLTSHFEKRSIAKHEKEMTAIASEFNVDNFEVIIARYQASQKNINSTKGRLLVGKAVAMVGVGAVASYNLSIEWNHLFGEAVNVPATGEASAPVEGAVASGGETPLVGSQSVVSAEATPVAEVAALPAEAPVANIHTVEKGDTLWKVIHDHIPGASNTEIANIVNQIETQGPKDFGVDSGEVDWIYPGDEIDLDKIDRLYGGLEHSGTGSVARDVNHASTSHVESQPETYLTHNPETHQIEDVRAQLIGMGDLSNVSARSVEQIRFFANHQNLLSYENLTSEILLISNENSALSLQTIYDHLSLVESFRGFDGCEAYQTMLVNIAENSKNIDIEKFHQLFGENAIYPPTLETTATSKMVLVIDFNEQNANGVRYVGEQVKINLSSGQTDFRTSANHLGGFGANPTLTSDSALNRFSFKEALDQIKK